MHEAKIIEHKKYRNLNFPVSSIHSAAELCKRQAVNAQWLWEHPDVTGYIYSTSNDQIGIDPWIEITGVDALTDGSRIILDTGRTQSREVRPDFEVYVSVRAIEGQQP